jgi:hypothetical protein
MTNARLSETVAAPNQEQSTKQSPLALVALIVGSITGGGVCHLSSDISNKAEGGEEP